MAEALATGEAVFRGIAKQPTAGAEVGFAESLQAMVARDVCGARRLEAFTASSSGEVVETLLDVVEQFARPTRTAGSTLLSRSDWPT